MRARVYLYLCDWSTTYKRSPPLPGLPFVGGKHVGGQDIEDVWDLPTFGAKASACSYQKVTTRRRSKHWLLLSRDELFQVSIWYFYDGPLGQWWAGWLLSRGSDSDHKHWSGEGRSRDVIYTHTITHTHLCRNVLGCSCIPDTACA